MSRLEAECCRCFFRGKKKKKLMNIFNNKDKEIRVGLSFILITNHKIRSLHRFKETRFF